MLSFQELEKCPLFIGLKGDKIEELLNTVQYKTRSFPKDEIISLGGDECRTLQIVNQGNVRGEMIDFNGKTIKIEDIESPRPLAPAFLFGNNNRYPVNIIANCSVEIISISKEAVVKLLQTNELFLNNYLNLISNRAQFLSGKIRFLSFQTIKGKIANYLLQLSKNLGSDEILLTKSQTELSELFGVTRPSLSRAMGELNNDGIIDSDGKKVKIIKKQDLANLLR